MSESPLHKAILDGLADRLSPDKVMPTGSFIICAEVLEADGTYSTFVASPEGQPTHRSKGLVDYAREYYGVEARLQIAPVLMGEED